MSLSPDFDTFMKLAAANPGKLIPVSRSFLADGLTPVGAYRRMTPSDYAFLLESVERGERIGRYSFVGSKPDVVFRGSVFPKPHYTIETAPGVSVEREGDPLKALKKFLDENRAVSCEGLKVPPFAGGAVGYLGYDVARLAEPRLMRHPPAKAGLQHVPEIIVPIYRTIMAFDHVSKIATLVHHVDLKDQRDPQEAYRRAGEIIDRCVSRLREPAAEPMDELPADHSNAVAHYTSNFEREQFCSAVEKAKQYISAGDIIQVVLSQRLSCRTRAHPFEIYRSLRTINPSPYMFYLRMGGLHLVGSSPEVMVRVEDGNITVRPIAGTRPRGKNPSEDERLARELLADPKERAEHTMLLDLGRNDVGRVAEYGSVQVTEKMIIENYSHVMHIVSNVSGKMRAGLSAFDVFNACGPAGTVSGAPKIRAMEIIDELEPDRRGPYAGSVGVMDFLGNLNTGIAIRTFVMQAQSDGSYDAHVQAGAGIVADSVPLSEYEETLNKARALLRALSAAEARMA